MVPENPTPIIPILFNVSIFYDFDVYFSCQSNKSNFELWHFFANILIIRGTCVHLLTEADGATLMIIPNATFY